MYAPYYEETHDRFVTMTTAATSAGSSPQLRLYVLDAVLFDVIIGTSETPPTSPLADYAFEELRDADDAERESRTHEEGHEFTHEELIAMDLAEREARTFGMGDLVDEDGNLPGME